MKKQLIVTQMKREFWENKVGFIYTPAIITILILVFAIATAIYSASKFSNNVRFHYSSNGITVSNQSDPVDVQVIEAEKHSEKIDFASAVMKKPEAFNSMVVGIMYANCVMLYLVFSLVLINYALRCLFDDRKNKDILFWRSMPVSEITNVLVKLGMVVIMGPVIMLVLNYITTCMAFVFGLGILLFHGVSLSYFFSSIFNGSAFIIPLQVFYELVISLLISLPIIGFAFLASAFSKKTPFFTFIIPVVLLVADKILASSFGINIGVKDAFMVYGKALIKMKDAFILQQEFIFDSSMIFPFVSCVFVGGLFIAGAIWLRNNRYEI